MKRVQWRGVGLLVLLAGKPAMGSQAETILAGWTFPTNSLVADQGIPANTNIVLSTNLGEPSYATGASTLAAYTNGWNGGAGLNFWQVSLSTEFYTNITLSSKMSGSDTGPKDFMAQYRVSEAYTWTDITNIVVANNWTTGALTNVPIPAAAADQPLLQIRWLMTSEVSVTNGFVAPVGTSRIDDIFVRGELIPQPPPDAPVALPATQVTSTKFVANWTPVSGAQAYVLDVARSPDFTVSRDALRIDFEGATKANYESCNISLSGLNWDITEALIGTLATDWKEGARSVRMGGHASSSMTLLDPLTNGLGMVTFQYRRYGADAQVDWRVEYTTNDVDWVQIGADFTAPGTNSVQMFSELVGIDVPARIRIKRATDDQNTTNNRRLNIDNIDLVPFCGTDFIPGYLAYTTTATHALVAGVTKGTYYYRVRAVGLGEANLSVDSNVESVRAADEHPTVIIIQ